MNSKRKIVLILIMVSLALFGLYFYYNSRETNSKTNPSSNDGNHKNEFTIIESNYIENNYQRYQAYKKEHSDYSDDKIITYVNIGLDQNVYENAEKTRENDGILKICNKHNYLEQSFSPNLASINSTDIKMEAEAAKSFNDMVEAAKKDSMSISPAYAYISYEEQESLYKLYVEEKKVEKGNLHYAKAGYSDYQTGLAVCINMASNDFQYTMEYAWLKDNAYKYGFILRYPKDKEEITGFEYEPWHYRYVGKDVAKVIYDKNITFEEYYATYVLK